MRKTGTINASNSTFVSYECDGCKHKESRCQGMLPEKDMY
jgi:hypothetical protein